MEEAAVASKKGYEINKEDAWAHHCLCHVLQHECRFKEAVEFMEALAKSWPSCSSFIRYSLKFFLRVPSRANRVRIQ
ncbi:predicted protein, partial [Arabidopsis lyrata subsp. lyrata]